MTSPMHPDDLAALVLAMAREPDRNKRARLGRRIADAYTNLFGVAVAAQEQAERVAASAATLAQMGEVLVEQGVVALADPERPLTMEDMAA